MLQFEREAVRRGRVFWDAMSQMYPPWGRIRVLWDTESYFNSLLSDFAQLAANSGGQAQSDRSSIAVTMARKGFSSATGADWNRTLDDFIHDRLQGDLAHSTLSWFEECEEAILAFSAFALGALLGRHAVGQIDDSGFLLGDAHLAGYNAMHDDEICRTYQAAVNTPYSRSEE